MESKYEKGEPATELQSNRKDLEKVAFGIALMFGVYWLWL